MGERQPGGSSERLHGRIVGVYGLLLLRTAVLLGLCFVWKSKSPTA